MLTGHRVQTADGSCTDCGSSSVCVGIRAVSFAQGLMSTCVASTQAHNVHSRIRTPAYTPINVHHGCVHTLLAVAFMCASWSGRDALFSAMVCERVFRARIMHKRGLTQALRGATTFER